ncbi:uncharacterized protein O3C94_014516 [Discoglossus pictus]
MALPPDSRKSRSLNAAGIAQIANDISRKFLDRSDLARLLRIDSSSQRGQTQVLSELDMFFISNPQARIKLVFIEDTLIVKNIFIMSPAMQELAQKFPEHLYVDFLGNICPGFSLYSVSCEDDISGWKMCAACISRTNNSDMLRFLIVSVLQSIPKMKAHIKTITIHPAIGDSLDMGTLLPNITIRHCFLLIGQVFEQKIAHLQLASQAQIKTVMHILLHTRSLKIYNRQLNEFKAICPAEIFQYYFETWHPSRKLWCAKDNKRLKAEKTIHTYSTSLHYTLASEISSSSLKDCLHVVLNDNLELKSPPAIVAPPEPLPEPEPEPVPEQPPSPSPAVSEQICKEEKTNGLECMEFSSWEDFNSFLNNWCEEQKTIFIIRQSVPLTDDDMSPDLIQSLKYSTVNLGCSSYTRKRCPATIQLKLSPHKDKLVITKVDLNHIHDSEIDLPIRFTKKPVSFVEVPATITNDDVSEKFMDRSDLTKLLRLPFPFGGESQLLDELETLFNSDPAAKLKLVYTEDKLVIKNIFIMTTAMQNLLQNFSEHLYIDFLPGLNQEFDLYSVLCQDESFSWKVCVYCITRKDFSESLRFLMRSALQSHPNLVNQVRHFTLSPEIRNPLDTELLLPNASMRYCLPLILDSMHRKISFLSQMEQSQIKNLLVSLSRAPSVEVYTNYLADLKSACPDEVFQFYFDTWHPCWKLWSEKDSRTNDLENTIFTFVKNMHQDIKAQVGSISSLQQCLQTLLNEDHEQEELPENNHVEEMEGNTSWESNNSTSVTFTEEQNSAPMVDNATIVVLKNSDEIENDQVNGKEFQSWDDFCSYLEAWSKEKFLVRHSSPLTENISCDELLMTPEMAVALKYNWAQLFCNWKDCPAFIELALVPQKEKLVITQSNLSHSHNVEEAILPPPAKKCKLSTAVGVPAQVANNISRKFLAPSDIKRLLRFRSGAFEDRTQVLAELETLFITDPQAKVKLVFVEDKLLVKKIFIMTSAMKDVAHKFPDNLFIDMFSEFSQSFDLYTIYCEEKGAGWRISAYCIAKKGVVDIVDFLIGSLVQIIPTLNGQVKHLTVNPEIERTPNIEAHLPHVTIRYGMQLVLDVLYRKTAHLATGVAAQIKNYLHILSQTCSLKVYDRYLNELKNICPADVFQYYYDTWHPRRKMWVKKDNKTEESERTIFELVAQKHFMLKTELGLVPSLHQCLCAVLGSSHKRSVKTPLEEADITPFFQQEESPDISPSLNEQEHDGGLSMMEEVEVTLHKATFSTKPIEEDVTENSIKGLERSEFYTWGDFSLFLDNWCEERKVMFAIRQSVALCKEELQNYPLGSEVAKSLKYSTVLLGCKSPSPPEVFQCYYEIWHPRRKRWVNESSKGFLTGSHIFSCVKLKHKELMAKLSDTSSLYQCLHVVLNESQSLHNPSDSFSQQGSNLTATSLQLVEVPASLNKIENEPAPYSVSCTTVKQEVSDYVHLHEKEDDGHRHTSENPMDCDIALIEGVYISCDLNGMKFHSWYQFCEFFDHLCKNEKNIYKIKNATHFEKTDSNAEVFKFQHVQLGCNALIDVPPEEICTLSNNVPNVCSATVTLQFSLDDNCLVVTEAHLEHTHKTDHQKFAAVFKYCSLTSYTQLSLLANSISGKFMTQQDLNKLLFWGPVLERTVLDLLKLLRALFSEDPKAQIKLEFFPETMQLESMFLMTSQMRCLLECFPSFLFLGEPLAVNETYNLYTAMCEDNEKNSRECAYFITLKDSPTPFPNLVASLIQNIPTLKVCVKDLLLPIDLKELNLVRNLLPSCRVRISQTHALNALYHHVKESDPATQEKLKGLMYSLVNCCNPDLYNTYFTELETSSPDNFLQYFLQTWHSCKKDWCHGMKEEHFLECAARQKETLLSFENSTSSPANFLQSFLKLTVLGDEEAMEVSDDYKEQVKEHAVTTLSSMNAASISQMSGSDTLIKNEVCENTENLEKTEHDTIGFADFPGGVTETANQSHDQKPIASLNLRGEIFQSWEKFCEFFDQWCEENKSLYKIAKVTPLVNVKEADQRQFRYQQVFLSCKDTGDGYQKRHSLSTMPLSCPASITLEFSAENNCLVISQAQLLHNHTLDPQEFEACFRHCSLTSRPYFASLTSSIACCFATSLHLKKLQNWSKLLEPESLDLLKELEILLAEDPMVKLKLVFCRETFGLESVFIMTSKAKNLLTNFPSLLFLGHSLMLNENFDLYTVLCEDNESNGRECAYFITRKESATPVRYLVVSLIQSIPEIKERIEGMVLRVDLKELDLIQDLLPSCSVRMSQSHALDTLYNQIRGEDSTTQEHLKRLIYNLVHSKTSSLYDSYYNELESISPEHFFQYFLGTWHIRKEDWAESWSHKMKDGNFLEFTPWQANELRAMLCFPSSLAACIKVLLEVVRSGEVLYSKNNSLPDFTNKECVELSADTRSIGMSCSVPEMSTLCTVKEEIQSENQDLNKATEVVDASSGLTVPMVPECFKMEVTEAEVHLQNSSISDAGPLIVELPEVFRQEALKLPLNLVTDAKESNDEFIQPPQPEDFMSQVLNNLTNGVSSTESQAPEVAIPSTSNSQDVSEPLCIEKKPLNSTSLEGRVFLSWIEFRNFFDRWCERNMVLYKIRCCRPLCKTDTFIAQAGKMISVLKYSYLHFVCKNSIGTQSGSTSPYGELPSPCQANIIVQAGPCNDRLIVTHAELGHNHQIMEEEFLKCFPRFMLKSKPFLFLEITRSISKQFLMFNDLLSLVDRSCDEDPALKDLLQELAAIFSKDLKAKIKLVFYPDIAEIKCIFIMTSTMRSLLERFPSLLYFDWSLSVNEHFDLYTAYCEDADHRGRACAYFISRKDSQTPVRFMVVSLMQSISDTVKPMIKTVVLHSGFEELQLIQSILPKRMVKMSQSCALEILNRRIEQEDTSVQETIKSIICGLVLSSSPEMYQSNLRELEAVALSDFFQYFLQNWHCHKEMWVACWNLQELQRSRFPSHVRIHQENLQSTINAPTSLALCVHGLLEVQSLKVLTSTLNEHTISLLYQDVCPPAILKLIQEEIVLTKQGHYDIKQLDDGFMLNDGKSDFLVNQGLTQCSCSIFKTSSLPCRHIFATRLWTGEKVFDVKLLQTDK